MRSAIDAVILLNMEAGTSSESLTGLLEAISEERGKTETLLLAFMNACFAHFSKVLTHLAKVKAHRDFDQK